MININGAGFQRYAWAVATLFLATPLLLVVTEKLLAPGFIANPMPKAWHLAVATLFAVSYLSVLVPLVVQSFPHWRILDPLEWNLVWTISVFLVPVAALAGALLGMMALGTGVPWLLHLASPAETTSWVERVAGKPEVRSSGDQPCTHRIKLDRPQFFADDLACGATRSLFDSIKVGDSIELRGRATRFGMSVREMRRDGGS